MSPPIARCPPPPLADVGERAACSCARRRRRLRPNERKARRPTPPKIGDEQPRDPAAAVAAAGGAGIGRALDAGLRGAADEVLEDGADAVGAVGGECRSRDSAIAVLIGSAFEATRKLLPVTTA